MKTRFILLLCALLGTSVATADVMVMKNGSRIIGTLVSADEGVIKFDTPWGGELEVKSENVESIEADSKSVVVMEDGEIYRDEQLYATQDRLVVQRENQPPREYDIEQIKMVNPDPWMMGEGYNFTGRTSLAFEAERGNSETDEWDADYQAEWRSLRNRFVSRGLLEFDKASGDKVTDKWEVRNKYDRFYNPDDSDNYWGGKLRFEYDRFADLDLRTVVGPHIGREFFDKPVFRLRGELGPVYVDEQFDVAEDNDYYGALFEFEGESDILGFGTTLYFFHDTTINFDSADEPLSNTTVGLRMPIILGFETSFQARWEYNGSAPDDVDTTDETYSFRIGYAW